MGMPHAISARQEGPGLQDRALQGDGPERARVVRRVRVAGVWSEEALYIETKGAVYLVAPGAEQRLPAWLQPYALSDSAASPGERARKSPDNSGPVPAAY